MATQTNKLTTMIDHALIPTRYKGWVRIDRPNSKVMEKVFPGCVQYWHEGLKQSLFFDKKDGSDESLMSTGTSDGKMYRTLLLGTWEDFDECCQRCGIILELT